MGNIKFDELDLNQLVKDYSDELKKFFSNRENQELLDSKNFEQLYEKVGISGYYITSLLLKMGIPFLNYMEKIPSYFFFSLPITSITIPDNIKRIDHHAFCDCTNLTSIVIPRVTTIQGYTFEDCTSLTSITIPDSVTLIGNHAFHGCHSLTNITIPNSVVSIMSSVFENCTNLKTINFEGTKEEWEKIEKLGWRWGAKNPIIIKCKDGDIDLI